MFKPLYLYKSVLALIFVIVLFVRCDAIQVPDIEYQYNNKIDSLVGSFVESSRLVGVSAGVLKDGKIIWQKGFGFRDVDINALVDSSTVFRLASVTKPMTAVAIMQLVEQGKLQLDVSIQNYLPDFPVHPEGEITIRQLLNHTSGIKGYRIFENRPTKAYKNLNEATQLFRSRGLKSVPGAEYHYSTYNYVVLGAIIEKVSGLSYNNYMQKTIWKPIKMLSTSTEIFDKDYPNKAKLYKKTGRGFRRDKQTNLSVKYPGGGVQSTTGDMLRFANAVLNNNLISSMAKKQMFEVPDLEQEDRMPYALGWLIDDNQFLGTIPYHDGHQSGASTMFTIIPSRNMAVVVLANSSNSENLVKQIAFKLTTLFLEES